MLSFHKSTNEYMNISHGKHIHASIKGRDSIGDALSAITRFWWFSFADELAWPCYCSPVMQLFNIFSLPVRVGNFMHALMDLQWSASTAASLSRWMVFVGCKCIVYFVFVLNFVIGARLPKSTFIHSRLSPWTARLGMVLFSWMIGPCICKAFL